MKILFAIMLLAVVSAVSFSGEYADHTAPRPDAAKSRRPVPATGARHDGFRIDPISGAAWLVVPAHQRPDYAQWGKADPKHLRHTTVAEVRISPILPKPTDISALRTAVERKMRRQETWRIKDFKYTLHESVRNGCPALDIHTECRDVGTTPASRMFSDGFMAITGDNRLLVVTVSERSDAPDFEYDGAAAREFIAALKW